MPLEGQVRRLLEEIKYTAKFPPRDAVALIKSELALKNLLSSGHAVERVSDAYLKTVERIVDEFADAVIHKHLALGLRDDVQLTSVIAEACHQLFGEARGALLDEFKSNPGYGELAMARLEDKHGAVWEHLQRTIELRKLEELAPETRKEREQKFGILLSPGQAARDFAAWAQEAEKWDNLISVLFVDLDHFRALNERWTHAKVDEALLPGVQKLLARLVQGRGEAYRYGGEEFLLILPNTDVQEGRMFAEKVRVAFEQTGFEVEGTAEALTVSIGVALWPVHDKSYQEVLGAANEAEGEAKQTRNAVRMSGGGSCRKTRGIHERHAVVRFRDRRTADARV